MKYKQGFKYQLTKNEVTIISIKPKKTISTDYIVLFKNGKLVIKKGYAWDGPSGPTIDTKTFMRGSLIHDALYQLMRMQLLPQSCRIHADEILGEICKQDGMCGFRRWYVVRELKKFGANAANPKNVKKVLTAP